MKKLSIAIAATGMLFATMAFAAKPANNQPTTVNQPTMALASTNQSTLTVGVIDLAQVLQNSPQMKKAADKLKAEFKPRQERIAAMQEDMQKNQDKIKRDSSVMSQVDLQALQDKVVNERRDLQRMQEDYMQDLQAAQQQAMQGVLQGIDKIVQNIASQGHYDLILQKNSVAFASQRVDITPQVIQQLKD